MERPSVKSDRLSERGEVALFLVFLLSGARKVGLFDDESR
jgi:hypothetical protein